MANVMGRVAECGTTRDALNPRRRDDANNYLCDDCVASCLQIKLARCHGGPIHSDWQDECLRLFRLRCVELRNRHLNLKSRVLQLGIRWLVWFHNLGRQTNGVTKLPKRSML